MVNIKNRLTELDVLLSYMDNSDWIKIPDEIIEYIDKNKNDKYTWQYDEAKEFEKQNVHKDTMSLFAIIAYEYIASPEEKEKMKDAFKENTKMLNEKYSENILLQSNELDAKNDLKRDNSKLEEVVEVPAIHEKSNGIFEKIKMFFKKIFHR